MQHPPKFSTDELQGLRQDLAATVYNQTTTQLLIYQRGLRMASTYDPNREPATKPESRKSSLTKAKGCVVQDNEAKNMPSEKLLNQIKLEKELAMLRRIYAVAYEELTKDEKVQKDEIDQIDKSSNKAKNNGENENKYKNQIDHEDEQDEVDQQVKRTGKTKNETEKYDKKNENDQTEEKDMDEMDNNKDESTANTAGAHSVFLAAVEAQKEDNNEEEQLMAELRHNQTQLTSLRTQIDTERCEAAERLIAKDERIATLRHNLRNIRRVNDLEVDLVERWEENRLTQATIVGENEERALLQQILALKQRLGGEQRIICEVQSFNGKQFKEFRTKIGEWKRKYADELAHKQAATLAHEQRIAALQKSHERHRQTYAERGVFVREYLAVKAEELRLFEAQMHRVECAVRIQAWWRGVMVRRGLGPYRKKSKKGKKGKAKAK